MQPAGEERHRGILRSAIQDNDPDIRRQAVIALSLAGGHDPCLGLIESRLEDKDVEVRVAAVASLADI